MPIPTISPIVPYAFWTKFTPVVPDIYKDAISQQQMLHDICCMLHKLREYSDMLGENINIDHEAIAELEAEFQSFVDGGFEDYYANLLDEWLIEHFPTIARMFFIDGVFFGLSDDGYFIANVANQMNFELNTISDPTSDNYGHLTITY